jgi:succinate dehydrogenase/fumarate reductase-like Fe-S protein
VQRNVNGDARLNSGEHVNAERANQLNREQINPFAQVFFIQDLVVEEDDSSDQLP